MNNATEKKKVKKPIPHKKIIIAVVLICVAFSGSFLVFFILQVSFNTESPIVVVISGSMEPNIHKGDLLFVMGTDAEKIKSGTAEDKTGDVIVFDAYWTGAPQEPIVHRVVGKYKINDTWYFETKGDANYSPDPEDIREDNVIGVVVGRIPYIGWIKIFLTESGLLIPLLVVISALLIISIVRDIIKGEDEEEDKTIAKDEKDTTTQSQIEK
jgi:signal peptidase